MPPITTSAEAYERLRLLTEQYTQVKEVYEAWAKIEQRCHGLKLLLESVQSSDTAAFTQIASFRELCQTKSAKLFDYLQKKQAEMDRLNSLIQNEVYNG